MTVDILYIGLDPQKKEGNLPPNTDPVRKRFPSMAGSACWRLFLFTFDGFGGAVVGAVTAVGALGGVDHILVTSLTDSSHRANIFACAAGNTIIRNYMCHIVFSLSILFMDTKRDAAPFAR
jgi:hypothetical protein